MPGPTILVRVLGDVKNLAASFKTAGDTAKQSSVGINDAFQKTLGLLNQNGVLGPFGDAIGAVGDAFHEMDRKGHDVGLTMLGLGGVFAGVGSGLALLGSKDQAARQQLQASVDATGKSWQDYSDQVDQAIHHMERFGDTSAETQNALQILVQATGDPQKALDLLGTAADLAAAKHESLSEAATQLAKVYGGSTKLLKQFGIEVDSAKGATRDATTATHAAERADTAAATAKQKLADMEAIDATRKKLTATQTVALQNAQQKVVTTTAAATAAHQKATLAQQAAQRATTNQASGIDQLAEKLKGQASAQSDTFAGKMKALTTVIEDQAVAFANKYGPALQVAGQAVGVLGAAWKVGETLLKKLTDTQKVATTTTEALTAASETQAAANEAEQLTFDGLAASETAAGIGALAVIGIIGGIVLAIAALGVAAYVIYRNWDTIWKAMKTAVSDVWDWIKKYWPYLAGFLMGPIGLAAAAIWLNWQSILNGLKGVWNWIKSTWNTVYHFIADPIVNAFNAVVNFFEGIPGKIASIASGMWDSVANAFVDAINFIIHVWNGLQFKVPGVSVFGHHFGGFTLGLPDIPEVPHLAQGGLITQSGLVFAHAGEAITPVQNLRTGPVVAIDNAHFSSDIDVDLFMRRVAWTVQTQKI